MFSGRGLFDGPIPRPEESYPVWGLSRQEKNSTNSFSGYLSVIGRLTIPLCIKDFVVSAKMFFFSRFPKSLQPNGGIEP